MNKPKNIVSVFFVLIVIISLTNYNLTAQDNNQGGVLKFSENLTQTEFGSQQNSSQIILTSYSGRPLKALQFNIIVGKNGGSLLLKSISRGAGIPNSRFLFDYEIYKGIPSPDGSSIDTVRVVLLGNGTNVIEPEVSAHLLTITYDVIYSNSGQFATHISLDGVLGATGMPVENANVTAGEDQVIYLINPTDKKNESSLLLQNYPNPFNPSTVINYTLTKPDFISLKIYNSLGQQIAILVNEYKGIGEYQVSFNASGLSSGVYFYEAKTSEFVEIRKMNLVR